MDLYAPIANYVTLQLPEKVEERVRNAQDYLVSRFSSLKTVNEDDLTNLEDARLTLASANSGIEKLPIVLLGLILEYATADGRDVESLSHVSILFVRCLHTRVMPRARLACQKYLVPLRVVRNTHLLTSRHMSELALNVADDDSYSGYTTRADRVIVYSSAEGYTGNDVEYLLEGISGRELVVESCISRIEHLYNGLDSVKGRFRRILVRGSTSYNGKLDRSNPRVRKLPPRTLHFDGEYAVDESWEITLSGEMLKDRLYPAIATVHRLYM